MRKQVTTPAVSILKLSMPRRDPGALLARQSRAGTFRDRRGAQQERPTSSALLRKWMESEEEATP